MTDTAFEFIYCSAVGFGAGAFIGLLGGVIRSIIKFLKGGV
jgi:hypothetical protein